MHRAAIVACAVNVVHALDVPVYDQDCSREWQKYLKRFPDKVDAPDRFRLFCSNLEQIIEHNSYANDRGFSMALNQFSDWTADEFKVLLGGRAIDFTDPQVNASIYKAPHGFKAAPFVDWRSRMPPVKDQGQCGSCWAFATIDVVDFHASGSHSEKQLLDCSGQGCGGGSPANAFAHLLSSGSDSEAQYPYQPNSGPCQEGSLRPTASVSNVQYYGSEGDLESAASGGVVAACIYGGNAASFQQYHDGVYDADCGDPNEGHCIGIVGYNADYWIIRNSWNTWWGMGGYMYMKKGVNLCTIGTRGGAFASASPEANADHIVV